MKRAMRRTGAPPRETAEARMEYRVPRHQWPAAWSALSEAAAVFVTGLGQASPDPARGEAAPVSVYVASRGAAILERLGARLVGGGADPWAARMREYERQRREAVAERVRRDTPTVDALEQAFQREAERVRARHKEEAVRPDGVPPALRVKQAAAVLGGLDERTLMRWCRNGLVRAFQSGAGGAFWIPTAEVERFAGVLMVDPDWERAA